MTCRLPLALLLLLALALGACRAALFATLRCDPDPTDDDDENEYSGPVRYVECDRCIAVDFFNFIRFACDDSDRASLFTRPPDLADNPPAPCADQLHAGDVLLSDGVNTTCLRTTPGLDLPGSTVKAEYQRIVLIAGGTGRVHSAAGAVRVAARLWAVALLVAWCQ